VKRFLQRLCQRFHTFINVTMKNYKLVSLITALFLVLNYGQGFSQSKKTTLFQKKEVLQVQIESNLKSLLKDRGENPTYHAASLSYTDEHAETVRLPIKMKVRGHFRRLSENCKFPPLLLDFSKKEGKKTVFDRQNKLKLVTQCANEEYVFREYLVYEMYNLLTDLSFKARLAQITYLDSLGKRKPETAYGFFIEDEEAVAKRNGAKNYIHKNLETYLLDSIQMATVALFQYMIGNHDWSVPALHNIKIFTMTGKLFMPMPYDFDHAGIVETNYALPPPQLNIGTVRERLYRGLNYSPEVFQKVFDKFNSLKLQIYALYEGNSMLEAKYIKRTTKYLDEFYERINDSKAIKKYFVSR
jgi:hypothetical protein